MLPARWEEIPGEYRQLLAQAELITPEEEQALGRRIEAGDESAVAELVQANLRLVAAVALRYRGRGVAIEDLIQEGNVALLGAVRRWDYRRNVHFSTYGYWSVLQAMHRAIETQGTLIRLPSAVYKEIGLYRDASPAAVPERIRDLLRLQTVASFEQPAYRDDADNGHTLGDRLVQTVYPEPERSLDAVASREVVEELLDSLPERAATILWWRLGLDGHPMRLQECARRIGLTWQRVRQIEQEALNLLREQMACQSR